MPTVKIGNDWDICLEGEFEKEYYLKLREFLKREYATTAIYPDMFDIFNALKMTAFGDVKVVILGQDPYINPGEAHGLSFSVKPEIRIPPSLMNVYKELNTDLGCNIPNTGCLIKWAEQGVLLLNAVLTVRARSSNSHKNQGWETFTNRVIELVDQKDEPVVFMLWGKNAQEKTVMLRNQKHLVLTAAHPSPLAGDRFMGCRHFSKANEFLKGNGRGEIDWQI
jgi:uracil-DNA glycosylase